MTRPWRATYRLQLRGETDFAAACELVPYLRALGISHMYLSPIFRARSGSTHGYDVVDPNEPDPVLGGRASFDRLLDTLGQHELGLVLDIVPNHMAASTENPWWRAMLRDGPDSPHAAWFDVDWSDENGQFRPLALPILGDTLDAVLDRGELKLAYNPELREVELAYYDKRLPLAPAGLADVDPDLAAHAEKGDGAKVEGLIAQVSPETLRALIDKQAYRPAFWRDTLRHLRYRRFFDVADLAGVRMEVPGVFAAGHAFIAELLRTGRVDGLRVDHVDGLADPRAYLVQLRKLIESEEGEDRGVRVHVEKILGPGEEVRTSWPVDGTTGYEFLNVVLGVFIDRDGLDRLGEVYGALTGDDRSFDRVADTAKHQVLEELFPAELDRLDSAGAAAIEAEKVPLEAGRLRGALVELIRGFEVYRTYVEGGEASPEDEAVLAAAGERAKEARPDLAEALDAIPRLLQGKGDAAQRFTARFQQLTGPVMAKALEDTAFYRWHRLVALNEVGGEPGHPPGGVAAFHDFNVRRNDLFPASLLATATHDTKRGEDMRARLAVLSEVADRWAAFVRGLLERQEGLRAATPDGPAPDPRTEYLFYQTLVGAWPFELEPGDAAALSQFADRLVEYLRKAGREAKERTFWTAPNEAFEQGVEQFVRGSLDPTRSGEFLREVQGFVGEIARAGVVTSLAQLLIKLTSPGVPDIYQGTEFWDLSLVDPDNRRPVDYPARRQELDDGTSLRERLGHFDDGRVKLGLLQRVLRLREREPALFLEGSYLPLAIKGPAARHALAYGRQLDDRVAITIVPRLVAGMLPIAGAPSIEPDRWDGTTVQLPDGLHARTLRCVLSDTEVELDGTGRLPLATALATFPMALLTASA